MELGSIMQKRESATFFIDIGMFEVVPVPLNRREWNDLGSSRMEGFEMKFPRS